MATQVVEDVQADDHEGRTGDPRPEKVAAVEEVRDELSSNPATILTEYRGLSVGELAELRGALREAGANYVVVKNTLARIAARDAGFEELVDFLTGPTALTYCADDPVGPAKALRRFSQDHPELVVKGGILEGRVVDAETADKLADLESREDLLAHLAQLMYGALANTASLLEAPISKMARLLAAYQEEGDLPEGEPSPEEPEAADEPEPADEPEEEPEAAEGPETAEEPEEGPEEEPEAEGAVAEVADTAADAVETAADAAETAVETAADAAETAVETAAETAKDVAEDTPAEGAVDAAAEIGETVAGTATDTVEDAAEAAAETAKDVVGSEPDETDTAEEPDEPEANADEDAQEAADEDDEDQS